MVKAYIDIMLNPENYPHRNNEDIIYRNKQGLFHRINGPSVIYPNGYQAYYINGLRHREDGPAKIHHDGTEEYYINGKKLTEKEFLKFNGK